MFEVIPAIFLRTDSLEDKIKNECFTTKLAELHKLWDSASPAQRKAYHHQILHTDEEWTKLLDKIDAKRKELNVGRAVRDRDTSSRYFFRKFNPIPGSTRLLYDENDVPQTSDKEILRICNSFYSNLYNQPPSNTPLNHNFIPNYPEDSILDDSDREMLAEEITLEELSESLKGMKDGKACGLDGISMAFLKKFWEELGPLLLASFQHARKVGYLSISQRRGVIKLIPKRDKNPNFVRNLRPISLLNIDFKVLTRALALRVKSIIDNIIASDQHAFIKDRYLGNSVLDVYAVASEAMTQDDDLLLFSLDIEKAFDSVRWSFLYDTLRGFGFPQEFIQWIQIFHSKKELRIFNNGHSSEPIKVSNSLAQGCVLSPFLFILCIETLARAVRKNRNIQGITIGEHEKKIGLVADDTVLVTKASPRCLVEPGSVLLDFERQSGLKINYDKSVICPLGPNKVNYSLYLPRNFLWLQDDAAITYLGMKLRLNASRQLVSDDGSWTFCTMQLTESVKKLRYTHHSLIGRVLLIKSMLASKFVYKFSLLPTPPKHILSALDKFYYEFLWQKGNHYISKNTMEQELSNGGFKMLNVFNQEKSLKFVWLQRLLKDPPSYFWQMQALNCFILPVKFFLTCNITSRRVYQFIKKDHFLPPFWCLLLGQWFDTRYINAQTTKGFESDLLQRPVCFNSVYRFNVETMLQKYHHLQSLSLVTLADFLRGKSNHVNDPQVRWFIRFLPTPWLQIKPDNIQMEDTLYTGVIQLKWTVKQIYWYLQNKQSRQPSATLTWSKELQTDVTDIWQISCKRICQISDTCLKSFQLRLLNRGYFTNNRAAYFMNISPMCTFCNGTKETFVHVLWECHDTSVIIVKLREFLVEYTCEEGLEWSKENFLLSNFSEPLTVTIVSLLKKFIFLQKWKHNFSSSLNARTPRLTFRAFLLNLRSYIRQQKLGFKYAKKEEQFYKTWLIFSNEEFLTEWDAIE